MTPKKILLCTDFSDNSLPARNLALEYAKAFGAEIVVLHVIDSWASFPAYSENMPLDMRVVVKNLEESAKGNLDAVADECKLVIGQVQTRARVGVPAEEIVEFAKEENTDLIVMGTHGWTGFKHMLLGSVAEKVLRMAAGPVLVVRSPRE